MDGQKLMSFCFDFCVHVWINSAIKCVALYVLTWHATVDLSHGYVVHISRECTRNHIAGRLFLTARLISDETCSVRWSFALLIRDRGWHCSRLGGVHGHSVYFRKNGKKLRLELYAHSWVWAESCEQFGEIPHRAAGKATIAEIAGIGNVYLT